MRPMFPMPMRTWIVGGFLALLFYFLMGSDLDFAAGWLSALVTLAVARRYGWSE